MRVPKTITNDSNLFIDECEPTSPAIKPQSDVKPSPTSEHIYTEIVKAIGNKKHTEEKTPLKRASWSPAGHCEWGLPPTGKRIDGENSTNHKNSNRVRLRSKPTRNYQLQQPNPTSLIRPASYNEKYERLCNQSLNRHQRREPSLSTDTLLQIPTRVSPSVDKSNFVNDTSLPLQEINPRHPSTKTRPLLNAYQQEDSDFKFVSPILNKNPVSFSPFSFTCQKGHEESSPSSPRGSSLNQYAELTLQTSSIDSSRDDSCHPTAGTTRSIMTMSISPNRQTYSSMTNNIDGLKQQQDQTESTIISGGCLKSKKNPNRTKKTVHFDWHSPTEIQSISNNDQPSVIVTSSSLSLDDNDEEKKQNDGETVKEKERIETTRRTIMTTTTPLTTHTIHRSFSLSPSPLSKEENNSNRRHRQVKKENVDELNCRRVTFNCNISPTKKSNGMNNFNGSENLTHQMPLNTLLVKTSSFNSPTPTKNGFFHFIHRSNNTNHPKSSSSTPRKSKQHENKRLSADVESLFKEDTDKVIKTRQKELDNNSNSSNSSNTDSSNPPCTNNHLNRSSISMSTITIKSDESDSLKNSLLFQPIQSLKKEPFYLSPSKLDDESSMQTSTLIISTPPQYHYYLYPPSISKKNSRTNVSMNSISTNSSTSSSFDLDDDTVSYSTYSINNQKQIQPVVLSDSVQNFWPPPPSPSLLNNDPEPIIMASTVQQVNSLDRSFLEISNNKQSQSNIQQKKFLNSTYYDDSLPMSNGNQRDEIRSYSDQSSSNNGCLRIASDSSLEDTQASYSERLREKSRSLNRPVAMNVNNYALSRSRSKDTLNNREENFNTTNRHHFRPKSAGQTRVQALLSPMRQEISNDFQSKRQFFENRTYTPTSTNNKTYTNSPINHPQRHVTKCSWNDLSSRQPPPPPQPESMIRTTKYFDSLSNQVSFPPTIYRKPVRIVKAVQRSAPSPISKDLKNSIPTKMNSEKDYLNELNLSSQYIRNLFPIPDHLRRHRSRENSDNHDNIRPTEDLLLNLKKRLEILKDDQRIINDEIEINTILGTKLMKIIESKAELNEIEKLKLHINEIETITSVLLKLSCRLAKVENDLLTIANDNAHTKANLLEQREKIQQKHDEAKTLKDGIDRRSRLVTNILRKYLSDEQFDDYEHFIRMKSTLLMDTKDTEETITFLQKQIQIFLNSSSISHLENSLDHLPTNSCKSISTTA